MRNLVRYVVYLFQHKRLVDRYGKRLGLSLWSRLWHDWTKFWPDELFGYARFYFGINDNPPDWRKWPPGLTQVVLTHVHRNRHHWEWHMFKDEPLPMPDRYRREMLADWWAASKQQGKDVRVWYADNWQVIRLHPETRQWVENQLVNLYPAIPFEVRDD